jgi:hypothetical protein
MRSGIFPAIFLAAADFFFLATKACGIGVGALSRC